MAARASNGIVRRQHRVEEKLAAELNAGFGQQVVLRGFTRVETQRHGIERELGRERVLGDPRSGIGALSRNVEGKENRCNHSPARGREQTLDVFTGHLVEVRSAWSL